MMIMQHTGSKISVIIFCVNDIRHSPAAYLYTFMNYLARQIALISQLVNCTFPAFESTTSLLLVTFFFIYFLLFHTMAVSTDCCCSYLAWAK